MPYAGGAFNVTSNFTQKNYLLGDPASGNSLASMLLGAAYTGEVDVLPRPYWSIKYFGMWLQDDVKLTSRLTINLGLRYDIQAPITERHNSFNHGFDFGAVNPINGPINHAAYPGTIYGGLGFAGVGGNSRSPFNPDYSNIQPRVGAAYRITEGFVLRGGYGIFYVPQFSQASQNGFSQPTPFVGTLDSGATISSTLSNPFPAGVQQPQGATAGLATLNGRTFNFSNASGQIGNVQSFSFGFQKQLPGHFTLDASYVGTRAHQLPVSLNINELSAANLALGNTDLGGDSSYLMAQVPNPFRGLLPGTTLNNNTVQRRQVLLPFPQFTTLTEQDIPIGKKWYNAFQMMLQQRDWHGIDLTSSYTFSKNLQAINYQNPQNAGSTGTGTGGAGRNAVPFADTALAPPTNSLTPYDRTHRLVIAPVYELPFGKGRLFFADKGRVMNTLISGWQGAAQYVWQSGAPTTAPAGLALIGSPNVADETFDRMFNTGVRQPNGTILTTVASDAANPAWRLLPSFAQKPTPQYLGNVRNFWGWEAQVTAAKNNYIRDSMNLQLRVEFLKCLQPSDLRRRPWHKLSVNNIRPIGAEKWTDQYSPEQSNLLRALSSNSCTFAGWSPRSRASQSSSTKCVLKGQTSWRSAGVIL